MLRIHGGVDSAELYSGPLGTLQGRLKNNLPSLDGIDEFLVLLDEARKMRNDLAHSLPVKHGLHRRTTKDLYYVRNFYTVESLREARTLFEKARRKGIALAKKKGVYKGRNPSLTEEQAKELKARKQAGKSSAELVTDGENRPRS